MLTDCQQCQEQLLDLAYGLLDAPQSALLHQHLMECRECSAEAEKVRKIQQLLATAVKQSFPEVKFAHPKTGAATPSTVVAEQHQVAKRGQTGFAWLVGVSAACLLFAIGFPIIRDTVGYISAKPGVELELAKASNVQQELNQARADHQEQQKTLAEQVTLARQRQIEVENQWIQAEAESIEAAAKKPFQVELRGPATALPGAPNEYILSIKDSQGKPYEAKMIATVRDSKNLVLFEEKFSSTTDHRNHVLKIPAGVWAKAQAGSELFLNVATEDAKTQQQNAMTESIRLFEPSYTTFLNTDKPMYQPGELVYFRSLTLDRLRFLPPENEQQLSFQVTGPSGEPINSDIPTTMQGTSKLSEIDASGQLQTISNPDGTPVRGIASGVFGLAADLPGGEYTLSCRQVQSAQPGDARPLAIRKFVVNRYTPERLLKKLEFDGKTYGPGAVVQCLFDAKDQNEVLANAKLQLIAKANGKAIKLDVAPATTDAEGKAAIKFTLPNQDDLNDAQIDVTITARGFTETLTRRVPLATRQLNVEFFPEGGDLLAGLKNRVYFRATTIAGKPADITGWLTDGQTDLARIQTMTDANNPGVNQGLGRFEFTPEAGKTYAVRLETPVQVVPPVLDAFPGTGLRGYELPAAKSKGVLLAVTTGVTSGAEPIAITLASTEKDREVLVGAYVRGRAIAHQSVQLPKNQVVETQLNLHGTSLGGVTRITVFEVPANDADGRDQLKPVAERLVYRQPGEYLQLDAKVQALADSAASLIPGSQVQLEITSQDEKAQAKPAILLAAVVNKSVLTMADEKTARLMPTHFLLSGEVQKGEDLEYSDFLLTDHPLAKESLDMLLGTQGWRRFAEQAPEQFRNRMPAESNDRLLLVSAMAGSIPTGWRAQVRDLFQVYWPKFETATATVEAAEQNKMQYQMSDESPRRIRDLSVLYSTQLSVFGEEVVDLEKYDSRIQTRRASLSTWAAVMFGLALIFFLMARTPFAKTRQIRTIATIAAVAMLLLLTLTVATSLLMAQPEEEWRELAKVAPKPSNEETAQVKNQMAAPGRMPDEAVAEAEAGFGGIGGFGGGFNGARRGGVFGGPAEEMKKNEPLAFPEAPGAIGGGFQPPAAPAPINPVRVPNAPAGPLMPKPGNDKRPEKKPQDKLREKEFRKDMQAINPVANARPRAPMADREMGDAAFGGMGPGFARGEGNAIADMAPEMQNALGNPKFLGFLLRRNEELAKSMGVKDEAFFESTDRLKTKAVETYQTLIPNGEPFPVRIYAHQRPEGADTENRTDFTETLLWQPVIVTPESGKATINFTLSDAIAPYEVMIAGHTADGRLGAIRQVIEVRKPLSVDVELPKEISSADQLQVPVSLTNRTADEITAKLNLTLDGLEVEEAKSWNMSAKTNAATKQFLNITPSKTDGDVSVSLNAEIAKFNDSLTRRMTVVQDGFPVSSSQSGNLKAKYSAQFRLPEQLIPGTVQLNVQVMPNTLSEIVSGLDGLLREPNGCFEQSSTTNYPNVLVLNYLNETNQAKPEVSQRAKDLLDRGYGKLTSFECQVPAEPNRKGYEWFGGSAPPHEALTAYGLMQFTDMAKVHPVDEDMLQRTKQYLLDARDGEGRFKRNARALDSFGRAPANITDAYILWSITEAERSLDRKTDLSKEFNALVTIQKNDPVGQDPYFLALLGNIASNMNQRDQAATFLKLLGTKQDKNGSVPGATTSITTSRGQALLIETTALAMLGWMKQNSNSQFRTEVNTAGKWLSTQRNNYGSYASTQATILALKALIQLAKESKRPAENGTIRVLNKGAEIARKDFTTYDSGAIVLDIPNPEQLVDKVTGVLELEIVTDAKQEYPITVGYEARTRKPFSSGECPIRLETTLASQELQQGNTVRLDVKVQNLEAKEQGMVIAIVGLPAGLKLPPDMKQLKALTEPTDADKEPTISYWETRGREVIFYWRGMAKDQETQFSFDLIADIPGKYRGPASRGYLYYGAEHKMWIDPLDVTITPAAE